MLRRRGVAQYGDGFAKGGLRSNGHIFAFRSWRGAFRGAFVVKLPRERVDALVASRDGKRYEQRPGRALKEWFVVAPRSRLDWVDLAEEARRFVAATN